MNPGGNLDPQLSRDPEELKRLFLLLASRKDVADLLEVPYDHLNYILYRSPPGHSYRTFDIPKKSGGTRTISAPPLWLRTLQARLNSVLQLAYPPKPSAHGFLVGRSIVSNALVHTGKRFVLNVDLEDFFPSINFGRVRGLFMSKPYNLDPAAATVLAQICCHDNQLPQGAPTSPVVSNMICAKLDSELQRLAQKHKCDYTRYADDLTFSTTLPNFPKELATCDGGWTGGNLTLGDGLMSVIASNGFRVNTTKQRLQFRDCHQEVTGLTVNEFPNVPRRFVRQVRAMLHAWEKYDYDAAEREFHEKFDTRSRREKGHRASFARVLRGKLDYLKMVKGEGAPTYRKLANKLHSLRPELIDALPDTPPAPSGDETAKDLTWRHWFEKYENMVFHVVVRKDGKEASGTAFAWRHGSLATAAHNLVGQVYISPPLPEGEPAIASQFVFHAREDEGVDLALIRLPEGALAIQQQFPLRPGALNPGDQVAALAYPTVPLREPRLGIYEGLVESTMPLFGGAVDNVQVDIEISGAMSGAPVIDRGGNLVGIVMGVSFEQTADDVPARPFRHILPVRYLLEIAMEDAAPGV